MSKGLSKSRYTLFRQCPKAMWLRTYKPEEAVEDAGAEARFEQGNMVGDLAMQRFGDFVEVTTYTVNMSEMIEEEYFQVPKLVDEAMSVINSDQEPEQDLHEGCNKPYVCAFLDYCKRIHGVPEDEPTLFDVGGMTFGVKLKHYRAGRITFTDLKSEKLTPNQRMQVEC